MTSVFQRQRLDDSFLVLSNLPARNAKTNMPLSDDVAIADVPDLHRFELHADEELAGSASTSTTTNNVSSTPPRSTADIPAVALPAS